MSITDSDNSELFKFQTSASSTYNHTGSKTTRLKMGVVGFAEAEFPAVFLNCTLMYLEDQFILCALHHSVQCSLASSLFFLEV